MSRTIVLIPILFIPLLSYFRTHLRLWILKAYNPFLVQQACTNKERIYALVPFLDNLVDLMSIYDRLKNSLNHLSKSGRELRNLVEFMRALLEVLP